MATVWEAPSVTIPELVDCASCSTCSRAGHGSASDVWVFMFHTRRGLLQITQTLLARSFSMAGHVCDTVHAPALLRQAAAACHLRHT